MTFSLRTTSRSRILRKRSGKIPMIMVGLLVIAAFAGSLYYFVFTGDSDGDAGPLLHPVKRGPYEFTVLEQGEVESSNNVELRCEVKTRQGGGGPATTILEVVPEGTQVVEKGEKTKPEQVEVGDVLVRLDSSSLEQEMVQQQIMVNTSEAIMMRAKNTYEAALIAKREYLEGTFKQEEQIILNEIYVAEESLRRAQETAKFSERLAARGFLTPLQLEGDLFAVEKYRNELSAAQTKLSVLREYTKEKMLKQFDSDINSAEVEWRNEQESHLLEQQKLQDIKDQIAKCTITAPETGTVVYANVVSSRGESEFIVEPGMAVRERQVILRLPDPNQMQVVAKINESRVMMVKVGMPVSIRIDAVGEEVLKGEVVKVNKYAEPSSFWSSNIKEYSTLIKIHNPPPNIRPGLTAEVSIHVDQREDALQLPVQAVLDINGRYFCVVKKGKAWEPREIAISSSNEQFVAVSEKESDPLSSDEMVVMNPRDYLDYFELPNLPIPANSQLAQTTSGAAPEVAQTEAPVADNADPRTSPSNEDVSESAGAASGVPQTGGGE